MIVIIGVACLVSVILVEVVRCAMQSSRFTVQRSRLVSDLRAYLREEDDSQRQKLILLSARTTFVLSLTMLSLVTVLAFFAWTPLILLEFGDAEISTYLLALTLVATLWWKFRSNALCLIAKTGTVTAEAAGFYSNYSILERSLHWLALEPLAVRRMAFDLERSFFLPNIKHQDEEGKPIAARGAVYVCGLARSGTTMVLRILEQTGLFRSLSYRDMPFVMAPNLWKLLNSRWKKNVEPIPRAHGDSMVIDVDSPEAFEEVFWNTFRADKAKDNCFCNSPSEEATSAFADYRLIITNSMNKQAGQQNYRYLSKNNNNLLRIETLTADMSGTILLMFRNPVATAISLYNQHRNFSTIQRIDRFTHNYMKWLAHHEFGLGHLPFCFALAEMCPSLKPDNPNYWLDYWNAVYRYVLTKQSLRFLLIDYDRLCAEPSKCLETLFFHLGIDIDVATFSKDIYLPRSESGSIASFDPILLERAKATHTALVSSPLNLLNSYTT